MSADALQASDGQRTLRVGQSQGLTSSGQVVGVSGSGYDVNKGIYVALCVVTPPDMAPSPCGGGIDRTGATGASQWVSSNPPSYGQGLAIPYGAGGTFSVNVTASAVIADGFDCRQVQCAIVSRNDHTRTADRSQDIFIPVTFVDSTPTPSTSPPTTAPAAPTTTAPPTTIAPPPVPTTTAPAPAPATEVGDDGRTGTVGDRSITVSEVADLDPEGATLSVDGAGFDPAVPVQVTLCAAATDPATAPAPCLAGASPEASKVVAPDDVEGPYVRFDGAGGFTLELEVEAVIDAAEGETDCREVDCVISVQRSGVAGDVDAAANDRSLDISVPVSFGEVAAPETTTEPAPPTTAVAPVAADDDGGGGSPAALIAIGIVVAVLAVAGALIVRSRSSASAAAPGADAADGAAPGGDAR